MAYYVYCDDTPIYDVRDEELVLIDPKISLEVNKAGSFTFKMPPNHPQYDLPHLMTSCIRVLQDDEEIFNGRPINVTTDFYNRKQIECEGQLAFLNDTIQRPGEYHDLSPREYLTILIDAHNEQVDESRQFEVGIVTVTDSNDSLYRYTNMNSTMDEIKEDLVDDLGGYLKVRNVYDSDGTLLHRYLDYVTISDYGNTNSQPIEFGENLLDFSRNMDMTDIATAIIPLGATLEESEFSSLEVRLTIADVNDGCDYLQIDEAVANYGFIVKTQTWDNVTTAAMLLSKAKAWLTDYQYEDMVIEAKAVDLHYTDVDIEAFRLGDMIRVLSTPHGLDKYFPLTKMTIYLNKLESNTITLGTCDDVSLTAKTNTVSSGIASVADSIPLASAIVQQAIDQATALITAATHGYVVTTPNEILIMDTDDVDTATKVWRWNVNGLGYSSTGYNGTYGTAITMDGQIVGDYIVGNSIAASKLSVEYTTQVENEIANAEETAESNANDYTDTKLTSYYTKSQVTTAIQNSANAVTLSAQEYAVQYVDGQLQNYYTSAQIDVKTSSIESTVSKKLNSSDFTTTLTQNYSYVRIAWNKCSKYIQFESAALNIYSTSTDSDGNNYKLMSLTYTGCHYYYNGYTVGKIGTNYWSTDSTYRGLVFDLEYASGYMCWAAKDSTSASTYTAKLIYHHKSSKDKQGLHFGCDTFADGNLYLTDDYYFKIWSGGGCGFYGKMTWCNSSSSNSVMIDGVNKKFYVYNSVDIEFYNTLNLNGWGYTNSSDVRLKTNIVETAIKGLDVVNAIDLKEFDWIQTGEHQDIGIIAQQIQPFAPELVSENADGHLQLKTDKLVYYCIKAIQELCEKLGYEYDKPEYTDPYTYLQKKVFCASLSSESSTDEEVVKEPMKIPIRK